MPYKTIEEAMMNTASDRAIITVYGDCGEIVYKEVSWGEFHQSMKDQACSLEESGWTSEDKEELMQEFLMTEDEAEWICDYIKEIEEDKAEDEE